MNALNVAVFIILIAIVVHKHSNVVVYGANIPNSIRSYNNNYKNLNAKAMEDALEHVGISPQVSASLINGNSNSNNNNKDVNELLRFSKAKGIEFNRFGLEGGGNCFGLVPKLCHPCTMEEDNRAGIDNCNSVRASCNHLFCEPLCLKTEIDCKVSGVPAPFEEINQPATSDALCRILEAHQCVKAGCCNSDDKLQNYVEEATVGALFPKMAITIEACNHNPADKKASAALCGECKAAIAGKIKAKVYPKALVCNPFEAYVSEHAQDPDCTAGERWCPRNYGFGFPGVHPHKSLKEDCEELNNKLKGSLPGVTASFAATTACNCLGCCTPFEKCPFPSIATIRI